LTKTQHLVRQVLSDLANTNSAIESIRYQVLFDDEHQCYQISAVGWDDGKQVLQIVVYIEIRDGLVWLQADNTDYGVGDELLRLGVPREKIVLGWQTPFMRRHSGFASGEAA
jgi:XisI protein